LVARLPAEGRRRVEELEAREMEAHGTDADFREAALWSLTTDTSTSDRWDARTSELAWLSTASPSCHPEGEPRERQQRGTFSRRHAPFVSRTRRSPTAAAVLIVVVITSVTA
jgi:hypothetical protein